MVYSFSVKKQLVRCARLALLLAVPSCLLACASSQRVSKIYYANESSSIVKYSGVGAASSMLLSSSLGPMGIAVGSAIDVGISNEINTTLTGNDIDLISAINTKCAQLQTATCNSNIKIESISLRSKNGMFIIFSSVLLMADTPYESTKEIEFEFAGGTKNNADDIHTLKHSNETLKFAFNGLAKNIVTSTSTKDSNSDVKTL